MSRRDLLIFALTLIKAECDKYCDCVNCPFNNIGKCRFRDKIPTEWYIPDYSNEDIEPIDL